MNPKVLYNVTYGVFMLAAKIGEKENGCIINTCMQVASSPTCIAISCLNSNLTCEMIKDSKLFTLSILDSTCRFSTIKTFGMQSGRTADKFAEISCSKDSRGIYYLNDQVCAVLLAHVVNQIDLGTHTLFIAELDDAFITSENAPLSYADYQNKLKPKIQEARTDKKIVAWRCKICGFIYEGSELPTDYLCPICSHPASDFEPIYE